LPNGPDDNDWLAAAARLAARGRPLSRPNPSVGCLIVAGGKVVGRGWTRAGGRPHAEAVALEQAGEAARGATVYVTLEPCAHRSARGPSCADLLVAAHPHRVVVGTKDPDPRTAGQGVARLRAAGIAVDEAGSSAVPASLTGYLTRARLGRPHVTLKLALSADGFIAPDGGARHWLTGPAARAHVHAHRAQADAILVGGGTWRADAPALDVRLPGLADRSPARVVLTRGAAPKEVIAIERPGAIGGLAGVLYLYVEGGAATASAFLADDLVDRIELYRAPVQLGRGIAAPAGIDHTSLAEAAGRWHLAGARQIGPDRFEAWDRVERE
jgi:diaminohydroxyphosphoribosylaminopyrimidine deaminase/5-amino-6-(5-phosphoribosylamino)uracil reductase